MERVNISLARITVGAVVCALAVIGSGVSGALASPPSVTLSGEGSDGSPRSPDSQRGRVTVSATLSQGIASGHLEAHFHSSFGVRLDSFQGDVTCMVTDGKQVTVGALGTSQESSKA